MTIETGGFRPAETTPIGHKPLTPGEIKYMKWFAMGYVDRQVASINGTAIRTARNMFAYARNKLGVSTSLDAAVKLIEEGTLSEREIAVNYGKQFGLLPALSAKEREVFDVVTNPLSWHREHKDLTINLGGIKKRTLTNHLNAIYRKMDLVGINGLRMFAWLRSRGWEEKLQEEIPAA